MILNKIIFKIAIMIIIAILARITHICLDEKIAIGSLLHILRVSLAKDCQTPPGQYSNIAWAISGNPYQSGKYA